MGGSKARESGWVVRVLVIVFLDQSGGGREWRRRGAAPTADYGGVGEGGCSAGTRRRRRGRSRATSSGVARAGREGTAARLLFSADWTEGRSGGVKRGRDAKGRSAGASRRRSSCRAGRESAVGQSCARGRGESSVPVDTRGRRFVGAEVAVEACESPRGVSEWAHEAARINTNTGSRNPRSWRRGCFACGVAARSVMGSRSAQARQPLTHAKRVPRTSPSIASSRRAC